MSLSTMQRKNLSGSDIRDMQLNEKVQLIKADCRRSYHMYSKQQTLVQSSYTHFLIRELSTVFFFQACV